jgi:hypothetical protein
LIHGDLTGNVLFHDELPPAIIDFTPYWRPLEFQSAVVVADALVWEGAPPSSRTRSTRSTSCAPDLPGRDEHRLRNRVARDDCARS